ncbi:hypothetical protein ACLOJK_014777, partial [Asimina triloba]
VEHTREEAFRLSSKLNVVWADRDEAIGRATAVEEKVLRLSAELIVIRSKTQAL